MKRIFVSFILFFCVLSGFAQVKTDAQSIFKMWLFLDKENSDYRGIDTSVSKNDSLYNAFRHLVNLKLDTLKIIKNVLPRQLHVPDFDFYELKIYDPKTGKFIKNETHNRRYSPGDDQFFGIAIGYYGSYVIAINHTTGLSYRLKGFISNDFLEFLSDFKEFYSKNGKTSLGTKQFLNSYQIEHVDFNCLYEGLTSQKADRTKYPCLLRGTDIVAR
jgi:hypothetical protein